MPIVNLPSSVNAKQALNGSFCNKEVARVCNKDVNCTLFNGRSFREVVIDGDTGLPLKLSPMHVVGGNVIVQVDEEDN